MILAYCIRRPSPGRVQTDDRRQEKEIREEMELRELVLKNRSCRGYDSSRKITAEELMEMVDLARLSASSVNRQPLKYVLVYEPEQAAAVQKTTKWARGLPEMTLPHPGKEPAAFIVICQDLTISDNKQMYIRDVGIAAQTILLGAVNMGLGGCMIGNYNKGQLCEVLHLDEHLEPILVVAVGKPDEEIVLTEVGEDGSTAYYRDENDVHYVPKRALKDVIITV